MRDSNVLAIAPTATISNIMGTTPCIEPNHKNLYVKSNLGGEFIILSAELVRDLKRLKLWNQEMLYQLKHFDGELDSIDDIPEALKAKHKTVFGIGHEYIVDAAARPTSFLLTAHSAPYPIKPEDRYHRFVRWSDEDQCYIGYCPDLYFGGTCHGEQEEATYAELCAIVRDEVAHRLTKGDTLPEPAVRATRDLDFAAA